MFSSRMISAVLAGGLILGSVGTALAGSRSNEGYQQFLAGHTGSPIADPNAAPVPAADNPFALYVEHGDPSTRGAPIAPSHVATARDEANNRVQTDDNR